MKKTRSHSQSLIRSYLIGFVASVLLTLSAFWFATAGLPYAVACIVAAALVQIFIQLIFFLHMGDKETPRANIVIFAMIILIMTIVIGGTLWIMTNLEHLHMHEPTNSDIYQNGIVSPANELH